MGHSLTTFTIVMVKTAIVSRVNVKQETIFFSCTCMLWYNINETKRNKQKRNETKRDTTETKQDKAETKRNETKRDTTETKRKKKNNHQWI